MESVIITPKNESQLSDLKKFIASSHLEAKVLSDDNKEAFLKHLLERNYGMSSFAYAIMEDSVFLKFTSEANTLTKDSLLMLFNKAAFYTEQSNFVPVV